MEGDSSHDCYNAPVSCCTCTDNGILDLQHCTLSSQPMGTLTHLSTAQSTQPKAKTGMSIMYFNARSIMPKFDELCAIVQSSQPDIICIVESWLSSDIENKEIDIPGYVLHRLDRNRQGVWWNCAVHKY